MIPVNPYCLNAGSRTPFGQALMHREQAVQYLLKSAIDCPPGGHTGFVLFSLTSP